MTIVTPDSEPLTLTRAWIGEVDGRPEPFAEIDGRICYIETKPTLLRLGVAVCIPVEGGSDAWAHTVEVTEEDSEGTRMLWDATTDPRVVAAARRWAELVAGDDEIQIGTSLL